MTPRDIQQRCIGLASRLDGLSKSDSVDVSRITLASNWIVAAVSCPDPEMAERFLRFAINEVGRINRSVNRKPTEESPLAVVK